MGLHRSPKPELLRLLLDHLPSVARNGTTQHHDSSNRMRKAGGLANGSAGAEAQSRQVLAASAVFYVICYSVTKVRHNLSFQHAQAPPDLAKLDNGGLSAYLEPRHVLDIVNDFAGSRPPLEKVCPSCMACVPRCVHRREFLPRPAAAGSADTLAQHSKQSPGLQMLAVLRPLQPRLYSISTSQLEAATRVGVTVAVVRYESLGRPRIGVTSTYTAERMQVCNCV